MVGHSALQGPWALVGEPVAFELAGEVFSLRVNISPVRQTLRGGRAVCRNSARHPDSQRVNLRQPSVDDGRYKHSQRNHDKPGDECNECRPPHSHRRLARSGPRARSSCTWSNPRETSAAPSRIAASSSSLTERQVSGTSPRATRSLRSSRSSNRLIVALASSTHTLTAGAQDEFPPHRCASRPATRWAPEDPDREGGQDRQSRQRTRQSEKVESTARHETGVRRHDPRSCSEACS